MHSLASYINIQRSVPSLNNTLSLRLNNEEEKNVENSDASHFSYPTIITIMWSRLCDTETENIFREMKNENDVNRVKNSLWRNVGELCSCVDRRKKQKNLSRESFEQLYQ